MNEYQAIYDAVRSRITNADVGSAVESAFREANISHFAAMAAESIRGVTFEYLRPSVLYRPALALDGDKWCALYGPDIQVGVSGFGDSPADAMLDFDLQWEKKIKPWEAGG